MSEVTWLYVLTEGDYGPVKIGITRATGGLSGRFRSLQSGNARRLRPVAAYELETRERARFAEQSLFKVFREKRLCGEWIDEVPELVISMASIAAGHAAGIYDDDVDEKSCPPSPFCVIHEDFGYERWAETMRLRRAIRRDEDSQLRG